MSSANNVWSSIQRLLVVVKFDQLESINQWREAIKICGLNINQCTILSIVETKKERIAMQDIASVVYISKGDYGLLGRLKNEGAQRILSDRYDAVIVVGETPKKIGRAIQKIRTNFDIGLNTNQEFRMINLQTEETAPKYMLNFVKQTVEKIS